MLLNPMSTTVTKNITKKSKREQIIEAAFKLFAENGFFATGVDLIMREAAVSKRTLYNYFPSKNELIVAVLQHYHASCQQHFASIMDFENKSARENIRALFEDAQTWFGNPNFYGCLAVNAMSEFNGKDQAIVKACQDFKQWEIALLTSITKQLDDQYPDLLACKLFILLEGMSSIAQVNKAGFPLNVGALADEIIDRHLQKH